MRASNRYLLTSAAMLAAAAINSVTFATSSQGAASTVWDGVYTDAQAKRGEEASKTMCVTCHGDELAGSDLAPALQGSDFNGVWSGRTAGELYEKINTTMPADRVGSLKPPQSADLVAYIFKLNAFPAGSAELASEMPALAQIKIQSKK